MINISCQDDPVTSVKGIRGQECGTLLSIGLWSVRTLYSVVLSHVHAGIAQRFHQSISV